MSSILISQMYAFPGLSASVTYLRARCQTKRVRSCLTVISTKAKTRLFESFQSHLNVATFNVRAVNQTANLIHESLISPAATVFMIIVPPFLDKSSFDIITTSSLFFIKCKKGAGDSNPQPRSRQDGEKIEHIHSLVWAATQQANTHTCLYIHTLVNAHTRKAPTVGGHGRYWLLVRR